MKRRQKPAHTSRSRRHHERGAALIMMLLISMLLLAAGGALIMTTSMTATSVYDSTPEAQAYYAAETGLEDTLNVLRGNRAPSAAPSCVPAITDEPQKISFRRALMGCASNAAGDPATPLRLSRWLDYDDEFTDRVAISPDYNPVNGTAYSISLRDPDNSTRVGYTVTGKFGNNGTVLSIGGGTLTYTPPPPTSATASPTVAGSLGTVNASYPLGLTVAVDTTLTLNINQVSPWPATYTVLGRVTGIIGPLGLKTVAIDFNEATVVLAGTVMQLVPSLPLNAGITPTGANTNVPVQITAPEPRRLIVSSIGYGPKGARKHLEMTLDNFNFLIRPPSPICIRGSDNVNDPLTFSLGNSAASEYLGIDASGKQPTAPAVAITLHDWDSGISAVNGTNGTVSNPKLAILDHTIPPSMQADPDPVPNPWVSPTPVPAQPPPPAVTPDFLRTAQEARRFLYGDNGNGGLRATAKTQKRYFTTFNGIAGDYDDGGFTFVDGNCELDGGGGLLIVTGNLEITGNDDFRGIIMVMGNGNVSRKGSGNGNVLGSWIVARFPLSGNGGFLAPTFNANGGGTGRFQFDWDAIVMANRAVGLSITGITER